MSIDNSSKDPEQDKVPEATEDEIDQIYEEFDRVRVSGHSGVTRLHPINPNTDETFCSAPAPREKDLSAYPKGFHKFCKNFLDRWRNK